MAGAGARASAAAADVVVPLPELRQQTWRAVRSLGYPDADAHTITEVLLYAQLRHNNQGIVKVAAGALDRLPGAAAPTIDHETPASALLHGHASLGMLVVAQAVRLAVAKAQAAGIAVVGTHHTSTSTGALGYWARQIAEAGLVGLVLAQSPEYVAPHGATSALFGTNPIAVGVPAGPGKPAIVLDMATSAAAWYALLEARSQGKPIPVDVGYNAAGEPTLSAGEVLDGGAIRVFDRGHKGSGLALMVEVLAGPLVGGAVDDKVAAANWGNLVLALDPALLAGRDALHTGVAQLVQRVKAARRAPGVTEVLLPGERGDRYAAEHAASNEIRVNAQVWQDLLAVAARYTPRAHSPASPSSTSQPEAGRPAGAGSDPGSGEASSSAPTSAAGGRAPVRQVSPRLATQLLHPPKVTQEAYGSVAPVLYQTATFRQPGATRGGEYDYTRSGNPTRSQLEAAIAQLEGGTRGFAFGSGMAALSAVVRLVQAGQHILAGDDIYGGTSRLLAQVAPGLGIDVSNVDMADLRAVEQAIRPGKTTLVMVESPTNPRMQICDIAAICKIAHKAGALVVVDNSIMGPLFQQPLALGADISMTSATKFVGGHSDLTAGLLTVKDPEVAKRVYFIQNAEGAILGPYDCWLALRGLKTMGVRMERQAASAQRLAAFLGAHPAVQRVAYAGLAGHPGAQLHARQASSPGSILSFTTGSVAVSEALCEAVALFNIVVSFGSVTSSISMPCYMSHASIPAAVRAQRGLPDDLVRISVGCEDPDDLLADLEQALARALEAVGRSVADSQVEAAWQASQQAAASPREQQLLQRIQVLEAQLQRQ